MIPVTKIRRVVARASSFEPQDGGDLAALNEWLPLVEGKRLPKQRVDAERLSRVLRLRRLNGMKKEHAIDAALKDFPGASVTTVWNHMNRAKPIGFKLMRQARNLLMRDLEDEAFDSKDAKQTYAEIAAERISAQEDFRWELVA